MNVKSIEAETTEFIRTTIEEHGFPTFSIVGKDGAHAAWMLIQHADVDPDFQQRALALMTPLVDSGEADPSDFAHLTDRVLVAKGDKPRFGTQFVKDDDGVLRPRPVESIATLDQSRGNFGLLPLKEHVGHLARALDIETSAMPIDAE